MASHLLQIGFLIIMIGSVLGGLLSCSAPHLPIPSRTILRDRKVDEWLRNPQSHLEWLIQEKTRCENAPFILPTKGVIGYLWDDAFHLGHHHQGIDIFSGEESGKTPIYAAYSGYLTRLADWKSSIIIRIPNDPLSPGRQIWLYYTHLADASGTESYILPKYPQGTTEIYVEEGTLLGYQGNFSGKVGSPVGVHLHFSIVKDDNHGKFLNELEIKNTVDPSPYFGLPLNAQTNNDLPTACIENIK